MRYATVPAAGWVRRLDGLVPELAAAGVRVHAWDLSAPLAEGLALAPGDTVGLVVAPFLPDPTRLRLAAALPGLATVQLLTAGFDAALPYCPAGVRLANAAGVHHTATAELAVALTLAARRGIPEMVRSQDRAQWPAAVTHPGLADARVLILGYGEIGRAIAARLAPFEVSLTAVASRPRAGDQVVERVHPVSELPALLGRHDIVIVAVPLTEATERLVDAGALAAMPAGALLVNVARGKVVDTEALLAEVGAGRLRAALDVTDPEPLPPEHPLWHTPGVLISPHLGGVSAAFQPRIERLIAEQLRRYAAGQPLRNLVT